MPSKNMLPKGKRRQSVKAEYRKIRTEVEEQRAREAEERAALFLPEPEEEETDDDDFYIVEEMMEEELPDPSNPYLRITNPVGTRNEMQRVDPRRYEGLKAPEKPVTANIQTLDDLTAVEGVRTVVAPAEARDLRLDAYLAKALPDISRARVQLLIDSGQITVNGKRVKAKHKLSPGETIAIVGEPQPAPLAAEPEDIPLTVVYEDKHLAVIDKPANMSVHAGAGSSAHNRGTLVNALLFRYGSGLADTGDAVRPGIVHRLDKDTSGLIVVAKNDSTHRKLGTMFSERALRKVYTALVHGHIRQDEGTIDLPIARDPNRRIRMTTKRYKDDNARTAVSHYRVLERILSPYGPFTLVEVHIETGRTHQIRVHMQALGHPVVGDSTYGAPHLIKPTAGASVQPVEPTRHFLHAAELSFAHPQTGKELNLTSPLPEALQSLLDTIRP